MTTNNLNKLFTASVIPNGLALQDGVHYAQFSVCVDINHENPNLDSDNQNIDFPANAKEFYRRFLQLSEFMVSDKVPVSVSLTFAGKKKKYSLNLTNKDYWQENCDLGKLRGVGESLWESLFTPSEVAKEIPLNGGMKISNRLDILEASLNTSKGLQKNVAIKEISSLNTDNTFYNKLQNNPDKRLNYSLIDKIALADVIGDIRSESKLLKTFTQGTAAAIKYKEILQNEQRHFISENFDLTFEKNDFEVLDFHRLTSINYIANSIDLNETFITYSQLSHHPVLMRLFGLITDFKIPLDKLKLKDGESGEIAIEKIGGSGGYSTDDFLLKNTYLDYLELSAKPLKAAILPTPDKRHLFQSSILNDKEAYLLNYDPMAQEQKIVAVRDKIKTGLGDVSAEFHDSFTRGIIYNHKQLPQIISPPKTVSKTLNEEDITMGSRVLMKDIFDHQYPGWISLTKRSTTILSPANEVVYQCGFTESCIHFDHVGNFMDGDTAEIKHKTSDALFEFKGELLSLNTVFSRKTQTLKTEAKQEAHDNPTDQSVYQSQLRMKGCLNIDYFPYDGKIRENNDAKPLKLRYGLPEGDVNAEKLPELKFGGTYQFLVFNQYKNGWALPLHSDDGPQANIDEIWHRIKGSKNLQFKYKRLENTKPVILFAKKPIDNGKDDKKNTIRDKDSSLSLVIRDGELVTEAYRHVLPDRISLEHAYWAGLLFGDNMDTKTSFMWKCRYNCSLKNGVTATTSCDEGCTSYCGGTRMLDNYDQDFIPATDVMYIPDPIVDGFTIELYWDKKCSEDYLIGYGNSEAIFEKKNPYTVRSFGLRLQQKDGQSGPAALINVINDRLEVTFALKKGMKAYAKLYNHTLDPDNQQAWGHDYWINQLHPGIAKISADDFGGKTNDPKNQPQIVSFTHAVAKPLFDPEVFSFSSNEKNFEIENPLDLTYIQEFIDQTIRLLQTPGYQTVAKYKYLQDEKDKTKSRFTLNKNIISIRPREESSATLSAQESTKMTFELVSRFERLDAITFNHYLPETSPTGMIELFMRKEEFIDDPNQIVLNSVGANTSINHFPEQPVYEMANYDKNKLVFEYKINFSNENMQQLKARLKSTLYADYRKLLSNPTNDPFQDSISQIMSAYDAKTVKYEFREYIIVNTSKYKGYYTLDQVTSDEKNTGSKYALKDFQRKSAPFPVLLLANSKPDKPDIAFMVTTIQQQTTFPERKTTRRIQNGNIITVYLNRGRLKSGRDERVGVLISNDSDYSRQYPRVSMVGRDIVSDITSPRSQYIKCDNTDHSKDDIVIPSIDKNSYDARYDPLLGMISYLPKFDIAKQLWKFEVEFNIKDAKNAPLHNPFLNLALVSYQPFAINHNRPADKIDFKKDCRISEIEQGTFCYLLPQRTVQAYFKKPTFILHKWGEAQVTVSFEKSSLNHSRKAGKPLARSNFIFSVEGSVEGQIWSPLMTEIEGLGSQLMHPLIDEFNTLKEGFNECTKTIRFQRKSKPNFSNSPNATEDHWIRYHKFRIRLVEVEWFIDEDWKTLLERYLAHDQDLFQIDILEVEEMRVRFVDLIY